MTTIQWLDGAGKTETIEAMPAIYSTPRFSPDGLRLAYAVNQGSTSEVWIYDLQRGGKMRLTNGSLSSYPVWSPDGRFVIFNAVGGIFWKRADGAGNPQSLIQSMNMQLPSSFTPDGTRLVFSEVTPDGGAEIRTMPVESKSGQLRAGEPQLFLKTSSVLNFAALSHDGRWLGYADAQAENYVDRLCGVAVVPSPVPDSARLWFMWQGCWQMPRDRVLTSHASPVSLDQRLRELVRGLVPTLAERRERQEQLALLARWFYSTWRDGEWIGFPDLDRVPYRKLVRAISRVHAKAGAAV